MAVSGFLGADFHAVLPLLRARALPLLSLQGFQQPWRASATLYRLLQGWLRPGGGRSAGGGQLPAKLQPKRGCGEQGGDPRRGPAYWERRRRAEAYPREAADAALAAADYFPEGTAPGPGRRITS